MKLKFHQIIDNKFSKMVTRVFLLIKNLAAEVDYGHIRHVLI